MMFHTDDNKALIEWPFYKGVDNSHLYRTLPYEERMKMIEALTHQNEYALNNLS